MNYFQLLKFPLLLEVINGKANKSNLWISLKMYFYTSSSFFFKKEEKSEEYPSDDLPYFPTCSFLIDLALDLYTFPHERWGCQEQLALRSNCLIFRLLGHN